MAVSLPHSEVFGQARTRLSRVGWTSGSWRNKDGNECLMQLVFSALGMEGGSWFGDEEAERLGHALYDAAVTLFGPRELADYNGDCYIFRMTAWNDHEGDAFKVMNLLARAEQTAQEMEAAFEEYEQLSPPYDWDDELTEMLKRAAGAITAAV